jgi:HEAT repeat protein/thiol-disulfide isomerase/thioredoxin
MKRLTSFWVFVVPSVLVIWNATGRADDDMRAKPAQSEATTIADKKLLPWQHSLGPAIDEARQRKTSIVVRVGAEWCGWCRKLDKEIEQPDVQKELANWVLVELDADDHADEVRRLNVGPIPALRVLNASGRTLKSHDGFLPAEKLIDWLRGRNTSDEAEILDEVTEVAELTAESLPKLVRLLGHRDASVREAVMRRLSSHQGLAGTAVVKAFTRGNLATRLSALEILSSWQAPIQDFDPWQPRTLTAARLNDLEEWSDKLDSSAEQTAQPATEPLTPEQLVEARSDIAKLLIANSTEVEAIGARLARLGSALLPEVREQRQQAETDKTRERLDWLRYRLVASDTLALKWPSGLIKLAATDAQTRRDAANELSKVVTSGEEALLIELFGHPDPLVRELSLKALQGVGGVRANAELTRLLADPEPNVRAAVLKQMAEKPSAKVVPQIAAYIAQEKDADLVVHAVRLLREIKGKEAVACLLTLLAHKSWQVRSEAIDAVGESIANRSYRRSNGKNDTDESQRADAYAAILEVLSDADGFVVSRAVNALKDADLAIAAQPLAKTAEQHPELAKSVAESLTAGGKIRAKATPLLREWLKHNDAALRAAALQALGNISELNGESEVIPALSDASEAVRIVAAEQLLQFCERQRPTPNEETPTTKQASNAAVSLIEKAAKLLNDAVPKKPDEKNGTESTEDSKAQPPLEDWLTNYRAGMGQPKWMKLATEPLKKFLTSGSADERLAGSAALIALGDDEKALPELRRIATDQRHLVPAVAKSLRWLPWKQRVEFFAQLRALASDQHSLARLCEEVVVLRDTRASQLLWEVLAGEQVNAELSQAVLMNLMQNHGLEINSIYSSEEPVKPIGLSAESLKPFVTSKSIWQQRVALALLLLIDEEAASEIATALAADEQATPAARADAFCVVLLSGPKKTSNRAAIAALTNPDSPLRRPALAYLTLGDSGVQSLGHGDFELMRRGGHVFYAGDDQKQDLPKELTAEHLRPFLSSSDDEAVAQAAYLLAMLGEPTEMDRLIARWRKTRQSHNGEQWEKLVIEAIAASDEPRFVPVIEEIYRSMSGDRTYEVRSLYWTIRSMHGPEILKLRKKIRDEVGMDQLR